MIMPGVDHHISPGGHVAGDARDRAILFGMMTVCDALVFRGHVALEANALAWRAECRAMRIVTITTGYSRREHLALFERQIIIGFLLNAYLSIGKKEKAIESRDLMRIGKRLSWGPIFREHVASRVAKAAGFDLLAQGSGRSASLRQSGFLVLPPCDSRPARQTERRAPSPGLPTCLAVVRFSGPAPKRRDASRPRGKLRTRR